MWNYNEYGQYKSHLSGEYHKRLKTENTGNNPVGISCTIGSLHSCAHSSMQNEKKVSTISVVINPCC